MFKLSEQRLFLKFFFLVKDLQMDIILKHMSKSPETTVGTETPLNFLRTFFSFAGGVEKTLWTQKFKKQKMTHVSILFDAEVLTSTSTINIGEPKNL